MKSKNVFSIIIFIFILLGLVAWKLNSFYGHEKKSLQTQLIQTQSVQIKNSIQSQLAQLKVLLNSMLTNQNQLNNNNNLSTFDENQINWEQLSPFYAVAQIDEMANGQLKIKKFFADSNGPMERLNANQIETSLNGSVQIKSPQAEVLYIYKDQAGIKHLVIAFFNQIRLKNNFQSRTGTLLIGDTSFFQRLIDLQRAKSMTQALLNKNQTVIAHSSFEYIGLASQEDKIKDENVFLQKQEIRGTNIFLVSYANHANSVSKNKGNHFFSDILSHIYIPFSVLGLIFGLGFLVSGFLLFFVQGQKSVISNESEAFVDRKFKESKPILNQRVSHQSDKPYEFLETPNEQLKDYTSEDHKLEDKEIKSKFTTKPLNLDFDESITDQSATVNVQIQACVQQALFNLGKSVNSKSIQIKKEFHSTDFIQVHFPKFVKIFEYFLFSLSELVKLTSSPYLNLKSFDQDGFVYLEIQTPQVDFNVEQVFLNQINKAKGLFEKLDLNKSDRVYRFKFDKYQKKSEPVENDLDYNISIVQQDDKTNENEIELDIDSILNLDQIDGEGIIEALTPQVVKLDEQIKQPIIEDTDFSISNELSTFEKNRAQTRKIDQIKIKMRKPEKT